MSSDEIIKAYKLQEELLKKHKGKALDEIFNGERIKTQQGSCYQIEEFEKIKFKKLDKNKAKSQILTDIKLIPGIGENKERTLKDNGYETIKDLVDHPQFASAAIKFMDKVQEPTPLTDYICRRYSNSHPHVLLSSSLDEANNFLFFDIETLGLKDLPVILIGMAQVSGNQMEVKQYLSTDLNDEKAILECFLSNTDDNTTFVSFNGRSFDLPFIRGRARHHGLSADINCNHLDLLHFSRRTWGGTLPNCRLQTLEKNLFGMERRDDVPSSLVPGFYKKYLKTGNIGPLVPIVEHNRQDIVTLAKILSRLYEENCG